jgi:hypothetical protein
LEAENVPPDEFPNRDTEAPPGLRTLALMDGEAGPGSFAQVHVHDTLTFDFADEPEPWGGPSFDPRTGRSHHDAFHVSAAEFEAIFGRVKAKLKRSVQPHQRANQHPPGRADSTSKARTATSWKSTMRRSRTSGEAKERWPDR